ncbi:MAG: ATP-binding cassette domain-containing protein, partial [Betaproteobacteria bacterium]|nr:ATP-binding cassette domain-containing protein [Betaproteobacteria bacterium]
MLSPSAAAPALELHDVACIRGSNLLFRGVTLRLLPGQMLRVRGANGCGKSSLLRVMCGLLPAAQGQVLWHGQPMRGREGEASDLLYLGHQHGLREELSARENLEFAASLGGERP